ncbi:hypothetical protein V2J09_017519 [Rumex salicifolius]
MKNSSLPKVRLVRCPRCRRVLHEPVDVPFYKCGECDTILQAKHYKKPIQNNEVESVAQGGEACISNPQLLTDPKEGFNRSNAENGNLEHPGVSNYSREASSTSQPKQQPPSSSDEESERNLEVTNCLREDSASNEPSSPRHYVPSNLVPETGELEGHHRYVEQHRDSLSSSSSESMEQPAQLVSESGEVRQDEIVVEEQLKAADSRCEAALSEATSAETDELNKNVSMNCRLEQPGVTSYPSEAFLSNEPSSLNERSNSSQVAEEEGGQVEECCTDANPLILSNEPTVDGNELFSHLGSLNEDMMKTEQHFVADGYCNTPASSNKSTFCKNKKLSLLVTENQDIVEGRIQNEIDTSNEDTVEISTSELDSKLPDESDIVLPESAQTSGLINTLKYEISTALEEYGNRESQNSVKVDATADRCKSIAALSTLEPTVEGEVLSLDDRSQMAVGINPREAIKEEKSTESIEVVDTHFEAGISCRDLPKSPTGKSFAYDGSVSSYDGNDEQVVHQHLSETMQGRKRTENHAAEDQKQFLSGRSPASSVSTFQHKMDNIQDVSPGEDLHSEEQSIPVMLNEIKMPEVMSDAPYRSRVRPTGGEFFSRVPVYQRSPEMQYESSDHLAHEEFYDRPMRYLPYQYRNVESRVTRGRLHRSDVDGRMISEAVWMGEEFHHMYPYRESSSEIYSYPRHQMHYHGRRQTEYQPLVHSMSRVPYSGETVRSGYRVVDSYSHLYPSDMRWSSRLPPPGVFHGRDRYGPRDPYESFTASPTHFTDSDHYGRRHVTFSEDQRHTNERRNAQPVLHFQPIGGAAPFITCYRCSELLQLPSDFLVFKGIRIHRVKCSACSSILKFTLEKSCHLVPYVLKSMAPLIENPEKRGADKLVKSASTSQADHDYEALHRRSASASIYAAGSYQVDDDQKVSLRSSSKALERPKSKHFHDKGKSVMGEMHKHNNSAGSSSPDIPKNAKVTWRLPDRSNSPLHRLMGYSSPSAVLYGHGSDDYETQSHCLQESSNLLEWPKERDDPRFVEEYEGRALQFV